MKLRRARVQNYRSIKDSGWFDLDEVKTILVGPNEGGKTALLRALEQLNPGPMVPALEPLRDFPRSEYHLIQDGSLRPSDVVLAEAEYDLEENERSALVGLPPSFAECRYYRAIHLDNSVTDRLIDAPAPPTVGMLKDHLRRLAAHSDSRSPSKPTPATDPSAGAEPYRSTSELLEQALQDVPDSHSISVTESGQLLDWLNSVVGPRIDEQDEQEMARLIAVREALTSVSTLEQALEECRRRLPVMVYVSTYPSLVPIVHLGHLADALDAEAVDLTDEYIFGNLCLLRLLHFTARQLSDMGKAEEPALGDRQAFEAYRRKLDERDAALNTASLVLTRNLRAVWQPSAGADDENEVFTVRIVADQQYLKVVVEDSLGVQIELDQRSQGFRWLVSFFVVFFAQASERSGEAVLLLDEPALSLHASKQRVFRRILSELGAANQLVFTTHSPFLVGPDELSRVRVVEHVDRGSGTKVRNDLAAEDPASLLPLEQTVAYDLAYSLFSQQRTLVFESLRDYWYFESTAELLADAGIAALDPGIELVPVGSLAGLVYFGTLLRAEGLRIAALLDIDADGPDATRQQQLVDLLDDKEILRTRDVYEGLVPHPRVEELLRETLVEVGAEVGWDVSEAMSHDWGARPVSQVFTDVTGSTYTPYRLAKAYVRWTRSHTAVDLTADERIVWMKLIEKVNQALA